MLTALVYGCSCRGIGIPARVLQREDAVVLPTAVDEEGDSNQEGEGVEELFYEWR